MDLVEIDAIVGHHLVGDNYGMRTVLYMGQCGRMSQQVWAVSAHNHLYHWSQC